MPRSYRVPTYVRGLFELLRFLGVEQKAVCQRLGASKSHVSMWASGDLAISHHQARPFVRFVADKLLEAEHQAKAQSLPLHPARRVTAPATRSLLSTPPFVGVPQREMPASERTTYDEWRDGVNAMIGQWDLEVMRARGDIHRLYCEAVEILETYKPQDVFKLTDEDLARIAQASRTVQRCLRFREQLELPPAERPWHRGPPTLAYQPVMHLWMIAAKADIEPEEEDEQYFRDV